MEETHRALVEYLRAIPAAEFDRDTGVRFKRYKVTVARLMQVEVRDKKTHYAQIEEFRAVVSAR